MELATMNAGSNLHSLLNDYAEQGRMYLTSAAMNLVQFGRVLTDAKKIVPHGQFGEWVKNNFGMSQSAADGYMGVYKRFGGKEQFSGIKFSSLREMLSLPSGMEEQFAKDNALDEMTSREVKEAVAKARAEAKAEAQAEIERERNARIAAENAAKQFATDGVVEEIREELRKEADKANKLREEVERQADMNRELLSEKREQTLELAKARADIDDLNSLLSDQQEAYNSLQSEMLNAKSAIAKGDAERNISEEMTSEDFASAVRSFIGYTSQIPMMGAAFASMSLHERERYEENIRVIEDWAERARRAINHVMEVILDA